MLTILIAAAKHENLGREFARIAVDHGLTQKLPFLFEGELTPYMRQRLVADVRRVCTGRRGYYVECHALTRGQAKWRVSLGGIIP